MARTSSVPECDASYAFHRRRERISSAAELRLSLLSRMETSTARITWKPALVARERPRVARGLLRAALVTALVPLAFDVLPALVGAPLGGALAVAASASRGLFGVAAILLGLAIAFRRGVARRLGVAVDKRSFFVGTTDDVRRIPRWQVAGATVRPPDRSVVVVPLQTGEIYRLKLADEAEARSLAAILAAAPRRRASDDD